MGSITFKLCTRHYRVYDEDPHKFDEQAWQDVLQVLGKYATLGYTQVIFAIERSAACDQCLQEEP